MARWFKTVVVLLALSLLASCGQDTPIKVGFIGGLTGRFADLGIAGRNGASIAVDWRNARGGINGRPVTLLIRDDEHQPDKARHGLRSLIAENVLGVVGPMTSAMASEIVPLADETQTVLIGGTIVTDRLTGKNDHLIRVIADTHEYAAQTARHLENEIAGQRTAIFFDLANRDYSEDWAKNYAREAKRLGNQNVVLYPFDSRKTDAGVSAAVAAFSHPTGAPQLVVLVCGARDALAIAQLARRRAPHIRLASAAWAATEQLLEDGQDTIEGMFFQQYHNVDESGESFRSFAAEYRQRYARLPDYAAIIAFDAMNVLLDTLETHPKKDKLRDAVIARRQFSGLNGLITLDANGDATRPYFAATVKHGHFVAHTERN